jgi:peptidoglycan glycosyltransferase
MERSYRRVAYVLFAGFAIVALYLTYWQVIAAAGLVNNPELNAYRLSVADRETQRGRILDREGVELAVSARTGDGFTRMYPRPSLVHVVGYVHPRFGKSGIESALDAELAGRTGTGVVSALRRRLIGGGEPGADVTLTIDARIQDAAERALGGTGAVVVLDPRSGAVLAMVSRPYFDANALDRDWDALRTDQGAPLLNRATQGHYAPGSIYKTVTASAALDLGYYTPATKFTCNDQVFIEGFAIRCDESVRGTFDLTYAYAQSCNACFGEIGLRVGGADLLAYSRRFGFESRPPIEIGASESTVLTGRADQRLVGPLLASTAFGQGELLVTPLQMSLVASAIANGGDVPTPYLVASARSADGFVSRDWAPPRWRGAVRPESAAAVRAMMVASVERGGAENARIAGVSVAGKTGTAEVGSGQPTHAWFIGFAPADAPRVAIVVVREHGGGGGAVAAPIAREVLRQALEVYR